MPFNPEYRAQLASYDKHWVSKLVLRSILILIDLTTIGLVAWATATGLSRYDDNYYAWDSDVIPWDFIPVCLLTYIAYTPKRIPLMRKCFF